MLLSFVVRDTTPPDRGLRRHAVRLSSPSSFVCPNSVRANVTSSPRTTTLNAFVVWKHSVGADLPFSTPSKTGLRVSVPSRRALLMPYSHLFSQARMEQLWVAAPDVCVILHRITVTPKTINPERENFTRERASDAHRPVTTEAFGHHRKLRNTSPVGQKPERPPPLKQRRWQSSLLNTSRQSSSTLIPTELLQIVIVGKTVAKSSETRTRRNSHGQTENLYHPAAQLKNAQTACLESGERLER